MPASSGGKRRLTDGEVALARSVFGTAIDYERVTIRRRKFFPLQPRHVTMAPRGHLHFHPLAEAYSDDFSTLSPLRQGLFIHEMTHVWQYYHGYWVVLRSAWANSKLGAGYGYTLQASDAWDDFNVEQQASLVEHWFSGGMSTTDDRFVFIEKIIRAGISGGFWASMLDTMVMKLPLSDLRRWNI